MAPTQAVSGVSESEASWEAGGWAKVTGPTRDKDRAAGEGPELLSPGEAGSAQSTRHVHISNLDFTEQSPRGVSLRTLHLSTCAFGFNNSIVTFVKFVSTNPFIFSF